MYSPGDAADDEAFMDKVFYHYYTIEKDADGNETGKKILTKEWARGAAFDIVQRWGHMNKADAEGYLNEHFEPVWEHADVLNKNYIAQDEGYNMMKSLMGSFSVSYSD